MHPKRREPGDVRRSPPPRESSLDPVDNLLGGYSLNRLFQILKTKPSPARKRRKQQQASWTEEETGLVAWQGCLHSDVGDEEVALIGTALKR